MKPLLWCALVLFVAGHITGPVIDPDLWWHITVGNWILAHLALPTEELWNKFALGEPWIAYSWSIETLLAFTDGNFGDYGLAGLKLLLCIVLVSAVFVVFAKLSGSWFFGALIGCLAVFGCVQNLTLRPQTFVWIYFVWVLGASEYIVRRGFSARSILLFCLPFVLWANAQITTVIGVVAAGVWLCSLRRVGPVLIGVSLAIFSTLFTPYFGQEWLVFFSKSSHPVDYQVIAEFQPAHLMSFSTGFLVLAMSLLLSFLHKKPAAIELERLLFGGALVMVGLTFVKFLPLATLYLSALLCLAWHKRDESYGNLAEGIDRLKAAIYKLPLDGLSFVLVCFFVIDLAKLWQQPLHTGYTPVAEMDYFIEQDLPHPILNEFGRGGYVMYRLKNEDGTLDYPVVMDGRTNINDPAVWRAYLGAIQGKESWRELLELTEPETILWRDQSPFVALLIESGQWCRLSLPRGRSGNFLFVKRDYFEAYQEHLQSDNCD